jgi:ankyrin repeat protein
MDTIYLTNEELIKAYKTNNAELTRNIVLGNTSKIKISPLYLFYAVCHNSIDVVKVLLESGMEVIKESYFAAKFLNHNEMLELLEPLVEEQYKEYPEDEMRASIDKLFVMEQVTASGRYDKELINKFKPILGKSLYSDLPIKYLSVNYQERRKKFLDSIKNSKTRISIPTCHGHPDEDPFWYKNAITNIDRKNIFFFSCKKGMLDPIQSYIDDDVIDPKIDNNHATYIAACNDHVDILTYLYEHGCKLTQKALTGALDNGNIDSAKYILKNMEEIPLISMESKFFLDDLTSEYGHYNYIKTLILMGEYINIPILFICCARSNFLDTVKYLLESPETECIRDSITFPRIFNSAKNFAKTLKYDELYEYLESYYIIEDK